MIELVAGSAKEAFASALILWLLGGVAISLAGSFAQGMIPSPPPGFAAGGPPRTGAPHGVRWTGMHEIWFGVFFAIFLAHSLWTGFCGSQTEGTGRLQWTLSKLREHWFQMIVGNAISAWAASLVFNITSEAAWSFSLWQIVWGAVRHLVGPLAQSVGRSLLGPVHWRQIGDWRAWYGANQAKLVFWMVYLGGVLDDLGVPNYKTLARWGWRRWRTRRTSATQAQKSRDSKAPDATIESK